VVHPDRIFRKGGARPGDALMMSKPLGTGIALASGNDVSAADAIAGMRRLNRTAAEQLAELDRAVHAVTDVTGYGLAGHGWEMAERSGARFVIESQRLVTYTGVAAAAADGVRTGGDARNRDYLDGYLHLTADEAAGIICFDPQTSGGLLAAVDAAAASVLADLGWWQAGSVESGDASVAIV
jgi:selenide,water dikinase